MIEFFTALALFFAAHVFPTRPSVRVFAVRLLGERGYLIAYSAISIALLGWVIFASAHAPFILLWTSPYWAYVLPVLIMPFSFMLMAAAIIQPNPLSIAFTKRDFDPANPGIVALTRHPVLWSFGLWAGVHIPPNGDLVSVILFALLALFAFTGMIVLDRKKRRVLGPERWRMQAANTSVFPAMALLQRRARWPRGTGFHVALAIGLALYVAFVTVVHEQLFGVSPLAFL